jgi:hypothetical protein
MKKTKLITLLGLLLAFCSLIMISCQREEAEAVKSQPAQKSDDELAKLVDRMETGAPDAEINAALSEYRQLSFEELETYNRHMLAKRKEFSSQEPGADHATREAGFNLLSQLRTDLNKRSVERFGKPYNQVQPEQINEIYAEMEPNNPRTNARLAAKYANLSTLLLAYKPGFTPGSYSPTRGGRLGKTDEYERNPTKGTPHEPFMSGDNVCRGYTEVICSTGYPEFYYEHQYDVINWYRTGVEDDGVRQTDCDYLFAFERVESNSNRSHRYITGTTGGVRNVLSIYGSMSTQTGGFNGFDTQQVIMGNKIDIFTLYGPWSIAHYAFVTGPLSWCGY